MIAEVCDVQRTGGGRGLRGGAGVRVDGVSPGRPQSFRYSPCHLAFRWRCVFFCVFTFRLCLFFLFCFH